MKKILFIIAILSSLFSFSQDFVDFKFHAIKKTTNSYENRESVDVNEIFSFSSSYGYLNHMYLDEDGAIEEVYKYKVIKYSFEECVDEKIIKFTAKSEISDIEYEYKIVIGMDDIGFLFINDYFFVGTVVMFKIFD